MCDNLGRERGHGITLELRCVVEEQRNRSRLLIEQRGSVKEEHWQVSPISDNTRAWNDQARDPDCWFVQANS